MAVSAIDANDIMCCFSLSAPKAQLSPTHKGLACSIDVQNASTVCPDSVLPELSLIVADNIIGGFVWSLMQDL